MPPRSATCGPTAKGCADAHGSLCDHCRPYAPLRVKPGRNEPCEAWGSFAGLVSFASRPDCFLYKKWHNSGSQWSAAYDYDLTGESMGRLLFAVGLTACVVANVAYANPCGPYSRQVRAVATHTIKGYPAAYRYFTRYRTEVSGAISEACTTGKISDPAFISTLTRYVPQTAPKIVFKMYAKGDASLLEVYRTLRDASLNHVPPRAKRHASNSR